MPVISKNSVKKAGINILYGAVIGASMLIPGVSGGTMAIILGIYDRLISSVSNIIKKPKENLPFLAFVFLGGLSGILLFSQAALKIIAAHTEACMFFFIGTICGSVPLLVKKSGIKITNMYNVIFSLIGIIAVFGIRLIPQSSLSNGGPMLIICGVVIAAAMVLPGISTSHVLLILGLYDSFWGGFKEGNADFFLLIGIGGIIGTLLTAKLTDIAEKRFPCQTYMVIIGFIMTSVYDIFPRNIQNGHWYVYLIFCAVGFAAAYMLSNIGNRKNNTSARHMNDFKPSHL